MIPPKNGGQARQKTAGQSSFEEPFIKHLKNSIQERRKEIESQSSFEEPFIKLQVGVYHT